ncbi:MAG: hypothetical protein ACXACB_12400, partial [Promethearchaeota archaeon]
EKQLSSSEIDLIIAELYKEEISYNNARIPLIEAIALRKIEEAVREAIKYDLAAKEVGYVWKLSYVSLIKPDEGENRYMLQFTTNNSHVEILYLQDPICCEICEGALAKNPDYVDYKKNYCQIHSKYCGLTSLPQELCNLRGLRELYVISKLKTLPNCIKTIPRLDNIIIVNNDINHPVRYEPKFDPQINVNFMDMEEFV